jgi:hypothetical protein
MLQRASQKARTFSSMQRRVPTRTSYVHDPRHNVSRGQDAPRTQVTLRLANVIRRGRGSSGRCHAALRALHFLSL